MTGNGPQAHMFRTYDIVYRDGGTVANNPSHLALPGVASFHEGKLNNTCLVSIGSGLSLEGNTHAKARR